MVILCIWKASWRNKSFLTHTSCTDPNPNCVNYHRWRPICQINAHIYCEWTRVLRFDSKWPNHNDALDTFLIHVDASSLCPHSPLALNRILRYTSHAYLHAKIVVNLTPEFHMGLYMHLTLYNFYIYDARVDVVSSLFCIENELNWQMAIFYLS